MMFLQLNCSVYPIPVGEMERVGDIVFRKAILAPISVVGFVGNVAAIWLWSVDFDVDFSDSIFMFKVFCVCANVDIVIFHVWFLGGIGRNRFCDVITITNVFMTFLLAYNTMFLIICQWLNAWPLLWRSWPRGRRFVACVVLSVWSLTLALSCRLFISGQSPPEMWADLTILTLLGKSLPSLPVTLLLVLSNWLSHRKKLRLCAPEESSWSSSTVDILSMDILSLSTHTTVPVPGLTYSVLCVCVVYIAVSLVTTTIEIAFLMRLKAQCPVLGRHAALGANYFLQIVLRSINFVIYAVCIPRFRLLFKWKFSCLNSSWPKDLPPLNSEAEMPPDYWRHSVTGSLDSPHIPRTSFGTIYSRIEQNIAAAKRNTQRTLKAKLEAEAGIGERRQTPAAGQPCSQPLPPSVQPLVNSVVKGQLPMSTNSTGSSDGTSNEDAAMLRREESELLQQDDTSESARSPQLPKKKDSSERRRPTVRRKDTISECSKKTQTAHSEYSRPSAQRKDTVSEYPKTSAQRKDTVSEYSRPSAQRKDTVSEYPTTSAQRKDTVSEYPKTSAQRKDTVSEYYKTSVQRKDTSSQYPKTTMAKPRGKAETTKQEKSNKPQLRVKFKSRQETD